MIDLVVGRNSVSQSKHLIVCWRPECALFKEWPKGFEQRGRGTSVAGASIDAKQLVLIVIEVDKIEADAAVACRRYLEQSAAVSSDFSAGSNMGPPTVSKITSAPRPFVIPRTADFSGLPSNKEFVNRGCRWRVRPELLPVDPDDAGASPFANLCRTPPTPPLAEPSDGSAV
jgi:hypothetical protein